MRGSCRGRPASTPTRMVTESRGGTRTPWGMHPERDEPCSFYLCCTSVAAHARSLHHVMPRYSTREGDTLLHEGVCSSCSMPFVAEFCSACSRLVYCSWHSVHQTDSSHTAGLGLAHVSSFIHTLHITRFAAMLYIKFPEMRIQAVLDSAKEESST